MTAAEWEALPSTGGCVSLEDGVRLRLSGPDAVRYLNGQVTQDVRKLHPGLSLPACVTNHKGQLEAWIRLCTDPSGAILISGPPDLRDFLPARLEKYLIADDCTLEDITGATALVHCLATASEPMPRVDAGEIAAAANRFGLPGTDIWTTPARVAYWQSRYPSLSGSAISTLEVLHAIPAWGHELTPGLLPPEARLDATAIDYHKGCYIGQEVISRIRSVGRVNRLLTPLIQTGGPPALPGQSLFATPFTAEKNPVAGTLTRTAIHPVSGEIHALAFLRRGTDGPLFSASSPDAPHATFMIRKTVDD